MSNDQQSRPEPPVEDPERRRAAKWTLAAALVFTVVTGATYVAPTLSGPADLGLKAGALVLALGRRTGPGR
ncbi:DUF4179 domain-containing protein [Streptomyces sp. NPDC001407]|uniref:DUF4179 domain-containing protein n=1 Tax=Streptomyces sp. NPDC001407 TaxID=3364573 RepID=UPI003692B92E